MAAEGTRARVAALLDRFGLPIRADSSLDVKGAVGQMSSDKKNRRGVIHCALPRGIGQMQSEGGWTMPVPTEHVVAALVNLRGSRGNLEPSS